MIVVYIVCKDKKEAKKISDMLIRKRLAACTNTFPISSAFRWKGKMNKAKETAIIAKTKESSWKKIKKEVRSLHSYEVPAIMKFDVEANEEFERWVCEETR